MFFLRGLPANTRMESIVGNFEIPERGGENCLYRYCRFLAIHICYNAHCPTCNNAVFIIVTDEPLEELELAPPFVMMLCLEWIVVSIIYILSLIHI